MRKVLVVLSVLVAACTAPQTSETAEDSVALESEDLQEFIEEAHEAVDADTTTLDSIKTPFTRPQINSKVAFVYRKGGLHVYNSMSDAGDTLKAVELLPYGMRIFLTEDLVNNQPSDKITFEGFKGRYIAVQNDEGTVMYVFSGYLTNFPVPRYGYVEYCLRNLQLISSPLNITSKVMYETTPEWWKTVYRYESGIQVDDNGYYEGSSTTITLPESSTMQEGLLLLKAFTSGTTFDSAFYNFPPAVYSKKLSQFKSANVESNETDGITRIFISDEGGCIDETYVEKIDGRVVIGTGGGC